MRNFSLQSLLQTMAIVLTLLGLIDTVAYNAGKFQQEHLHIIERLDRIEAKL